MQAFRVYYFEKWVQVHQEDAEKAKQIAISLFPFKYPELKEMETDDLVVVPVSKEQPKFALEEVFE